MRHLHEKEFYSLNGLRKWTGCELKKHFYHVTTSSSWHTSGLFVSVIIKNEINTGQYICIMLGRFYQQNKIIIYSLLKIF